MGMPKQREEPTRRRDEIAEALRSRIAAGEFVPGALIPSSREVAEEYTCAPMTAQAALRILADEGTIITRPRQGSIVAIREHSVSGPLERLDRSVRTGVLFRPGEVPQIITAQLVVGHPEALAAFGLERDAVIGMREYVVRDAAGAGLTYGTSWFPPEIWARVPELGVPEPIVDGGVGAIRRILGLEMTLPRPFVAADEARELEAGFLGVAEGSPVLLEVSQVLGPDGTVLEYAIQVHRARTWVGR
jgi:GntR family transcriptional regulator